MRNLSIGARSSAPQKQRSGRSRSTRSCELAPEAWAEEAQRTEAWAEEEEEEEGGARGVPEAAAVRSCCASPMFRNLCHGRAVKGVRMRGMVLAAWSSHFHNVQRLASGGALAARQIGYTR